MHIIKPAALTAALLFGLLVCADAWADNPEQMSAEAYAKLPVCKLNSDGTSLQVQPCRTAPAQSPMPRRPVPQIIERQPQTRVSPQPAMPAPPTPPATPSLARPPVPVTSCDAGGCNGANGVRYNNTGNGVAGPNGKVCTRAGATVQC
jgi:hypothetical protein